MLREGLDPLWDDGRRRDDSGDADACLSRHNFCSAKLMELAGGGKMVEFICCRHDMTGSTTAMDCPPCVFQTDTPCFFLPMPVAMQSAFLEDREEILFLKILPALAIDDQR